MNEELNPIELESRESQCKVGSGQGISLVCKGVAASYL